MKKVLILKKLCLILVLLCVFCCGCNADYVAGEKKSTLFSYEKDNMVDYLTSEEQK